MMNTTNSSRPFAFASLWLLAMWCQLGWAAGIPAAGELEQGWNNPPRDARLRAYWWWLNGNVTKEAITRDLEEMKDKGFGGALICDAGGAEQRGNAQVPHGPTFGTPAWRELYKHTLREADRLGLEMSLNILSGWNLGGPMIKPEDAAKKLVWTELRATGPAKFEQALPTPKKRDGYYQDLFVVAYRLKAGAATQTEFTGLTVSSEQANNSAERMADGNPNTFWVSNGSDMGQGPTKARPVWVQLNFSQAISADRLVVQPRPGYGPRDCEIQVSDDGKTFRPIKVFTATEKAETVVSFSAVTGKAVRLVIFSSFDPRFPQSPRNVQIAELKLSGKDGAWPASAQGHRPIQFWQEKAVHTTLHFSAPDTAPLFQDFPAEPGEEDTQAAGVIDLTTKLGADGVLRWEVPEGNWQVFRFGCTIGNHATVSTSSEGWAGYAVDALDRDAFKRYWDAVVEPLIADAKPWLGRTLKYLHTDSWEVEAVNWTPTLREEFRKRRGYDLLPFLPVLAGRMVNSRPVSNRFLHDFRRTIGDLVADNHYGFFLENAHKHGLQIHPESGGPHAVPLDAQQCLGIVDAPMSEFWAWSWEHRIGDSNRFFLKQPASAAHTYGRRLVLGEGFTTIGPHWQETIWDNLKPAFDHALCEGLNLLVWHAFVCSPKEMGIPGQQYFAGTHFNPNTTWWPKSGAFLGYVDRSQFLLQQGLFVADACYYYGDHVPNFTQIKSSNPAKVLPGYDYDVLTADALIARLSVKDGRLVLPDGMSYRVLVLPDRTVISLPVLRKLKELVAAGATVIGPKPTEATGLQGYPQSDAEVARLAGELWGDCNGQSVQQHAFGKGRVFWGKTAREVLQADGVKPDCSFTSSLPNADLDYIHRNVNGADIYFVASRSNRWEEARCAFRVSGKAPEIWNAVTGERRFADAYEQAEGQTVVPLEFSPYGSWFVIFRDSAAQHPATAKSNQLKLEPQTELAGPWIVKFDPKWGGPAAVQFDSLISWPTHPDSGIKYYSGTATYEKTFAAPAALQVAGRRAWLDLGAVRELAEVRLNGKPLGIVWAPPFRVEITGALKPSGNVLEVEVVNFWPNRIIGDQFLPEEKRFTKTNVRKLTQKTALMESGLLGPVRLMTGQ
ncbi:MAG: glycosyl hydrolase [Verrucomicrobiota bacterium]